MRRLITVSTYEGEATYETAMFGERLLARIVDYLIIGVPAFIVPVLAPFLYWVILQGSKSEATLGQRAMGIRVIKLNGGRVGMGLAALRFLANYLNILSLFVGYLMYFFTDKHQCIHDYVANVAVVRDQVVSRDDDLTRHLLS